MQTPDATLTDKTIETLTTVADLPVPEDRRAPVADLLAAWLPAANELSRKMSAAAHQALLPATVFAHVPPDEEG